VRALVVAAAAAVCVGLVATNAGGRPETVTSAAAPHIQLLGLKPVGQLQTAVFDGWLASTATLGQAFARVQAAGASAVRVTATWSSIAPGGSRKPSTFHAANPADLLYRWETLDTAIRVAIAHQLQPIVVLLDAPAWAEGVGGGPPGTRRPDARELAQFATAAARRYSGTFQGLPRVRYWQVWNEPNLHIFLSPQVEAGRLVSPEIYRAMLNLVAPAIHAVHSDNVVIAGGTAPFGQHGWYRATPPLKFTRDLLCMRGRVRPAAKCGARTRFDVWAHHPYTGGDPSHHAAGPDDVSLPELPQVQRLLRASWAAHHIVAQRRPPLWVTEFSWDTKPPDPKAVPERLQARWVSEALYRMWSVGVSVVTWFQLQDDPMSKSSFQSGLYFANGRAKLALRAFRFPFVALPASYGVSVWGRTRTSTRASVVVQQTLGGRWKRVAALTANRYGIFRARLRVPSRGLLRAVAAGDSSLPFAVKAPPDYPLHNPFGS